jgi:hypothetical protein
MRETAGPEPRVIVRSADGSVEGNSLAAAYNIALVAALQDALNKLIAVDR